MSTFTVEMSELRTVLRMTDAHSLILGDELCSGTETTSAVSIFVAGVQHFLSQHSSFLFATHFHEMATYTEITSQSRVCVKHMAVQYVPHLDALVYTRTLMPGSGTNTYGLEVCKSMHMPTAFLEQAYVLRNKYHGTPHETSPLLQSTSHFNARKIVSMCERCNLRPATQVHHLHPQHMTSHVSFHKHHVANLQNVCDACHDACHHGHGHDPDHHHDTIERRVKTTCPTQPYILIPVSKPTL
jgi:DNA mismatch repair protein MutS